MELETYRIQVKAELDAIEQERKRLRGQQRDLHFRAAIVAGKFQLLKQMEMDASASTIEQPEISTLTAK